eukprot:COSAG03_NODE_1549_length_3888_cov_2.020042_4_plen_137_part_00
MYEKMSGKGASAREAHRPNMGVDGAQHIVQEDNVCVRVHCACEREPLALASTQSDALLANLSLIARREQGQIRAETARLDCLGVPLCVIFVAEKNVVSNGCVHNKGALRRERSGAVQLLQQHGTSLICKMTVGMLP